MSPQAANSSSLESQLRKIDEIFRDTTELDFDYRKRFRIRTDKFCRVEPGNPLNFMRDCLIQALDEYQRIKKQDPWEEFPYICEAVGYSK